MPLSYLAWEIGAIYIKTHHIISHTSCHITPFHFTQFHFTSHHFNRVLVLDQHEDVAGGGTHMFDLKGYPLILDFTTPFLGVGPTSFDYR